MRIYAVRDLRDASDKRIRQHFGVVVERTCAELRGISCVVLEDIAPPRKQIVSSRAYGEHPLMKRFHKMGDEKRSLVIVPQSDYEAWLNVKDPAVARSMLSLYPADLMKAWPAPRSKKAAKPKAAAKKRSAPTKEETNPRQGHFVVV